MTGVQTCALPIYVDRLETKENENMIIDKVLLFADGENVLIGEPYLNNVKVQATVLGEIKGKKVRGIKFKKRKNYTRTLGHRQTFSQLKISDLSVN